MQPYEPGGNEPPQWEPLFDRAVAEAATVREIGQAYRNDSGVGFEYQLEVMAGLAIQAARVSRLDVQPMVLWDEKPGRGMGGTASFVDFWRRRFGLEPVVLRPPPVVVELPAVVGGIDGTRPTLDVPGRRDPRCEHNIFRQEVKSMLFADIVGYSKLNESVIPEFVNNFLAKVSRTMSESRYAPRHVNTWGDAIYAVFDYAQDAGCFALELTQLIHEGRDQWLAAGLYWEETTADGAIIKHPTVHAFTQRVPGPWVLKPRFLAGALGIKKAQNADELWGHINALGDQSSFYLVEKYIPGDIFHVDALTEGGKQLFARASGYGRPPLDVTHGDIFTTRTLDLQVGDGSEDAGEGEHRRAQGDASRARGVAHRVHRRQG